MGEHRPNDRGGIVLSGHTDVVPTEGQPWTVLAFEMTERDGRLYGRGITDIKGYLACVLAAVLAFQQAELRLLIHLAFSYDEEVGCLGVRSIIEMLKGRPHQPVACIIGEPTELQPVLGRKGKLGVRCHVHGAPCHSAHVPRGRVRCQDDRQIGGNRRPAGRPRPPGSTLRSVIFHRADQVFEGGRALNIVPSECRFDWEVRSLPGFDASQVKNEMKDYAEHELVPQMRAVVEDTGISFEPLQQYPGLTTEADSEVAELIATLTGRHDFGTEGGLFHQVDIPTVVCGSGSTKMNQGHKLDEFIAIEQLEQYDAMKADGISSEKKSPEKKTSGRVNMVGVISTRPAMLKEGHLALRLRTVLFEKRRQRQAGLELNGIACHGGIS